MLLAGATLSAQPCPYCGGVRVIKDGDALCTGCGSAPAEGPARGKPDSGSADEQIRALAAQLASEPDGARRAEIASAIGRLAAGAEKARE